jgi:cell wall-associated NlpC family hydrolase
MMRDGTVLNPATLVPSSAVVATARSWIGTRWAHQGRSRAGIDCAGLVIVTAHQLGLFTFDTRDYGKLPNGNRMRELLDEHCVAWPAGGGLQPGLIALMRFEIAPQHLAIIADYPSAPGHYSLVHALVTERRVCEHRLDTHWRSRIIALYALPGVAYPVQG